MKPLHHLTPIFFLITQFSYNGNACLNEFHVNKAGKSVGTYEGLPIFYRSFDEKLIKDYLAAYDLQKISSYDYKIQSDVAVYLIKLGQLEQAKQILQRLYKVYPRDYSVTVNLGTLYELLGKNDSALILIKRGVRLNPGSHQGSEWFHVRVLEAKIKTATNPEWVLKNKVINLKEQANSNNKMNSERESVAQIDAIIYQLQERIPFTPTPNLLLANILNEFGDLLAEKVSIQDAYIIYKIAEEYDTAGIFQSAAKINELLPLLDKENKPRPSYTSHFRYTIGWNKKGGGLAEREANDLYKVKSRAPQIKENKTRSILVLTIALLLSLLALLFYYKKKN